MKQEELTELVMTGKNNEALTTSKIVSDNFDKKHKNVLQNIENLVAENSAVKSMFTLGS